MTYSIWLKRNITFSLLSLIKDFVVSFVIYIEQSIILNIFTKCYKTDCSSIHVYDNKEEDTEHAVVVIHVKVF